MDAVVPCERLVALIEPYYLKRDRSRPPMCIERMQRIYFLQQWYGLAEELLKETIYDSQAKRGFTGIDLSVESVPDATTLLKFLNFLETHKLTMLILEEVNAHLSERRLLLRESPIVDATIIAAHSSIENKERKRDPEMHQSKKGYAWHFGMKAHIGVDARSGLVHTVTGTAANVADIAETHELLHGQEKHAFADAGYTGVDKREELATKAGKVNWYVAMKQGKRKAMAEGALKEAGEAFEKAKALPRAIQGHRPTPHALRIGQPERSAFC